MKNVKRILLVSLMILTTGCFGVDLTKYYDKMQVAEDGIKDFEFMLARDSGEARVFKDKDGLAERR